MIMLANTINSTDKVFFFGCYFHHPSSIAFNNPSSNFSWLLPNTEASQKWNFMSARTRLFSTSITSYSISECMNKADNGSFQFWKYFKNQQPAKRESHN